MHNMLFFTDFLILKARDVYNACELIFTFFQPYAIPYSG